MNEYDLTKIRQTVNLLFWCYSATDIDWLGWGSPAHKVLSDHIWSDQFEEQLKLGNIINHNSYKPLFSCPIALPHLTAKQEN